ncbi:NBS resistance protein, partial [Trifolium medium]|nr:NBS resistance protein [Trifolium medium]
MVERDDFAFKLAVVYESLPEFCSHCKTIGHHVLNCKWLHPPTAITTEDYGKQVLDREVGHKAIKKEYVVKATNRESRASEQRQLIATEPAKTNGNSKTPIIIENIDHKKLELIREETNTMPTPAAEVEIVLAANIETDKTAKSVSAVPVQRPISDLTAAVPHENLITKENEFTMDILKDKAED